MKLEPNVRVGKWTLVKESDDRWLCVCDCGTTRHVATRSLKESKTKSCGCQRFAAHRKQMALSFKEVPNVIR